MASVDGFRHSRQVLLEMMDKVQQQWKLSEFTVKTFRDGKDPCVLGSVDEVLATLKETQHASAHYGVLSSPQVLATLEETQLVVQSVMASPHVPAVRSEADMWYQKLQLFSATMDEMLACQRSWMYLESIFVAPDIQRQLPTELKMFQSVDHGWRSLMKVSALDGD